MAFGFRAQLLQLAEELSEASAAASRLVNGKVDHTHLLVEELVDVESVIASLRAALAPEPVWVGIRSAKEDKLRAILEAIPVAK